MVTTRSQDKMTFADSIRAKGFSLADCKFVKLNALFPIMLSLAHATVALWCGSGLAGSVVSAIPVADGKVVRSVRNYCRTNEFVSRPRSRRGSGAANIIIYKRNQCTGPALHDLRPTRLRDPPVHRRPRGPGRARAQRLPKPDRPRGQGAGRHRRIGLPGLGLDRARPVVAVQHVGISHPRRLLLLRRRRGEAHAFPLLRARGAPPRLPPRLPAALRAGRRPRPHASLAHGPLRRGPCGIQINARRVGPRIDSTQATIMVAACALYPETMQPLFA